MAFVELRNISAGYERNSPVLQHFDLAIEQGELVSILGPSGCGKTTTLRTIAGFIEPEQGQVHLAGRDVTKLPPNKRNIGLVFQSYALFPHLSVHQNVAFGLKMRGVPKAEIDERVARALATVDLSGLGGRLPAQLSGGQRQRVALSRAIVIEPDLLLLDEPLSNLDAKLRIGMRAELANLQRKLGITMVYVTHDQVEALSLSDRVVVMNKGAIEQSDPPEEIYLKPRTAFVARFLGCENEFSARYEGAAGSAGTAGRPAVSLHAAGVQLIAMPHALPQLSEGSEVACYARPEELAIAEAAGANSVAGEVVFRSFQGSSTLVTVHTQLGQLQVVADRKLHHKVGDRLYVHLPPESLVLAHKE